MSDSDEPDYMSDAFLQQCVPQDVRPGLKRSHKEQRSHELMKKKSHEFKDEKVRKTKAELEEEQRQLGLQQSIGSTNKGFAMLQKMGYKEGDSLGKDKCSGIKEPISIAVKANRTGLGRDALLKQVEKETQELRLKKLEAFKKRQGPNFISTDNFRAEKSNQRRRKQFESDLYQSQKSCRQLDLSKGFELPPDSFFWPPDTVQSLTFDDNETERENVEDLTSMQKSENTDSENSDSETEDQTNVVNTPSEVVPKMEIELEPCEMLPILTRYLRFEHLYCLWCGITFTNDEDLQQNCPGPTRDDHD